MMKRNQGWVAGLAMAIAAGPVAAEEQHTVISSDGDEFAVTQEADGAVLRSLYPKARFFGQGAGTELVRAHDEFVLGYDCKAYSQYFGVGTWSWANGGFGVGFEGIGFAFPRQDAPHDGDVWTCRE